MKGVWRGPSSGVDDIRLADGDLLESRYGEQI